MIITEVGHWLFAGLSLTPGTRLPGLVGSEYDRVDLTAPTPRPIQVVAHSPVNCQGEPDHSDVAYYTTRSGAGVINVGTSDWIAALDSDNPDIRRIVRGTTTTLLTTFAAGPAGRKPPPATTPPSTTKPPADTGARPRSTPPEPSPVAPDAALGPHRTSIHRGGEQPAVSRSDSGLRRTRANALCRLARSRATISQALPRSPSAGDHLTLSARRRIGSTARRSSRRTVRRAATSPRPTPPARSGRGVRGGRSAGSTRDERPVPGPTPPDGCP